MRKRETATEQADSSVQTDLFAAYVNYLKHTVRSGRLLPVKGEVGYNVPSILRPAVLPFLASVDNVLTFPTVCLQWNTSSKRRAAIWMLFRVYTFSYTHRCAYSSNGWRPREELQRSKRH